MRGGRREVREERGEGREGHGRGAGRGREVRRRRESGESRVTISAVFSIELLHL